LVGVIARCVGEVEGVGGLVNVFKCVGIASEPVQGRCGEIFGELVGACSGRLDVRAGLSYVLVSKICVSEWHVMNFIRLSASIEFAALFWANFCQNT